MNETWSRESGLPSGAEPQQMEIVRRHNFSFPGGEPQRRPKSFEGSTPHRIQGSERLSLWTHST